VSTLVSQGERPPPAAPAGTGARKLTERAFRIRESGIIVVLVVFVAVTASVQPRFLNITNIQFILVNTTVFVSGAIAGVAGAGKLGSFTVGADKTVLLGPPFVFTSDNINQFDF
jgi:ABC-type glucose/galactose transport system permease subunit